MMLRDLPPVRVYTLEDIATPPQHQEIVFADPNDEGTSQRYTMYTGEISVSLEADNHKAEQIFQYPVLGTFFKIGSMGIMPLGDPNSQFRSAIANAFLTESEFGSNPVWADVMEVSADLMQIQLDCSNEFIVRPPQTINAVVLSGRLVARNASLKQISYRVSVLDRLTGNPLVARPILLHDRGWNGKYILGWSGLGPGSVGFVQKRGIPQDRIVLF